MNCTCGSLLAEFDHGGRGLCIGCRSLWDLTGDKPVLSEQSLTAAEENEVLSRTLFVTAEWDPPIRPIRAKDGSEYYVLFFQREDGRKQWHRRSIRRSGAQL